jgi:hypothetical protein
MEEEEENERKKNRRKKLAWGRRASLGLDPPCWLCSSSQLLGAIKG